MQNRISDFQFLRSALRFTIARSTRATAFAIHRVARRIAPRLVRELALDALQPRAGERPSARSIDALLVHAIETDTRLLFFREDVIVFAGERCSLDRIPELKAARLQLADRIEDLFGVDVPGSTGDVADREARAARAAERAAARARRRSSAAEVAANARTERPTDFESDRDWSPPQELVLAPWEVDAESIPPRREHERGRSCDADGSRGAAPAPDAADRAVANPTPPLPRPRDSAPDPNVPPRQDDSSASQETPQ